MIRFDIIFYVRTGDGLSRIIVNVEVQKDEPSKYFILNRGIFYGCRMLSSQKGRNFTDMNYNDIKQVYSIWICMNMDENSLNHIHLTNDSIIGYHDWEGNLDLLNIIMIGLTNELPPQDEAFMLHRFLGALLSSKLPVSAKLKVLEDEYGIPVEGRLGEEVKVMCNLSQGIREEALAEGQAKLEKIIQKMHTKGFTLEQITEITDITEAEVENIIKSRKSMTFCSN